MQMDRVDDTGVWGWLVDWGKSYEAYLPIGSIGKEKGRGERKAQAHFLTNAKRSLWKKGRDNDRQGLTLVVFVQSVEAVSQRGVATLESNIEDPAWHLAVTRRGMTEDIEKEALDLSRDVQFCARLLVDKAAHSAGVSRKWARQVTIYHAYEEAFASKNEGNDEEEEEEEEEGKGKEAEVRYAVVDFLVKKIGSFAPGDTQKVLDVLGAKSACGERDERTTAFAARLLDLCREEKERRAKPVLFTATAVIGGPKHLMQAESFFSDLSPVSMDTCYLQSAFHSVTKIMHPKGCEPATVAIKGNGKYTFSSMAPPEFEQVAFEYLEELVRGVQDEWVKLASMGGAGTEWKPCPVSEVQKGSRSQPSLNIGVCGDVANGKSTLVKAISGKRTQCHSSEQQHHGITIRLGFANSAVLECQNTSICGSYSFLPESDDDGKDNDEDYLPKCKKCEHPTKVVKRFSLLDCPGHAELMATMLAGASAFDAVLFAAASNLPCPTPQARQHLDAIKMSDIVGGKEPLIAIAQTKAELLADERKNAVSKWNPEERLENHVSQGRENLKDTVAAKAPFFPVCSPLGLGLEAIAEWIVNLPSTGANQISESAPDGASGPRMTVLRSFDVNRPGTAAGAVNGGVLGGTLVEHGLISVGDILEIRPGLCFPNKTPPAKRNMQIDKSEKKISVDVVAPEYHVQPLRFRCMSLMTGKNALSSVGKGGLVAVGTSLDPSICADNRMVGSVVGPPGTLPPVWGPFLFLDQLQLVDLIPETGAGSKESKDLKATDLLKEDAEIRCHLGSATVQGRIVKISNKARKVEVRLSAPVCTLKGANVAIEGKEGRGKSFALVAHAKLVDGDICLPGINAVDGFGGLTPRDRDSDGLEGTDSNTGTARLESDMCHRTRFLEDLQKHQESGIEGLSGNSRVSIPRADIARDGGAHVLLSNFGIIAYSLRREAEHLVAFLEKEGGLSCVLAGARMSPATTSLRVKWRGGRNFAERFESILKKYVKAYVTCNQCRGAVTELLGAGKTEQLCRRCNARRFVAKLS